MQKNFLFLFFFLFIFTAAAAQDTLQFDWQQRINQTYKKKDFIQTGEEAAHAAITNKSGGYTIVGKMKTRFYGDKGAYMVFLDANGKIIDQIINLNRDKDEEANAVIQTLDGGYAIVGYSNSPDPSNSSENGGKDGWLIKTDKNGEALWNKNIGTPKDDVFYGITEDENGNLYIVGSSSDKPYLVKTDAWGNIKYKKTIGSTDPSVVGAANAILYKAPNITLTGFELNNATLKKTVLVAQYNTNDQEKWLKNHPQGEGKDLIATVDGGFAIAGVTQSRGSSYVDDMLLMKIDKNGVFQWQKEYGGGKKDAANAITLCPNGDFILAGYTYSQDRTAARSNLYLCRTAANGEVKWKKNFGGKFSDEANDVLLTTDGAYLIAGFTCPSIADGSDMWVLKTKKDTTFSIAQPANFTIIPKKFIIKNADDTLRATERGWYSFSIQNSAPYEIRNAIATVRCLQPITGLEYIEKLQFGHIAANSTQIFGIPIFSNKELINSQAAFEVVISADNAPAQTFNFNILTKQLAEPKIIVQNHHFENAKGEPTLRRGDNETTKLKVTIKNTGIVAAHDIVVKFGRPKKIYATSPKDTLQRVAALVAGASKELTFTIGAEKGYWLDSIPISVSIAHKELSGQNISICTTQFAQAIVQPIIQPNAIPMADYINLTWITPNEDAIGNTITVNEPKLNIKINAKSNKPLNKDSFELIITPKQVGAKYDKVNLKSIFIDGATITKSMTMEYQVPLQEGDNEIKVRISNGKTRQETPALKVKYVLEKPSLHILAIGVQHVDLEFPRKDAADFIDIFRKQTGNLFKNIHIKLLNQDANTTRDSIVNALSDIEISYSTIQPRVINNNDIVAVFLSTHGNLFTNDGKFLLQCRRYEQLRQKTTAIDFQDIIINTLKEVKCKKLIFLDACFSGQVAQLNIPSDFVVLASSSIDEKSWENSKWQNGAFTRAIVDAIIHLKGVITLDNLFTYLKTSVPKMVEEVIGDGRSQHPTMIINNNTLKNLPLLQTNK
jgi:Caspase domain